MKPTSPSASFNCNFPPAFFLKLLFVGLKLESCMTGCCWMTGTLSAISGSAGIAYGVARPALLSGCGLETGVDAAVLSADTCVGCPLLGLLGVADAAWVTSVLTDSVCFSFDDIWTSAAGSGAVAWLRRFRNRAKALCARFPSAREADRQTKSFFLTWRLLSSIQFASLRRHGQMDNYEISIPNKK